MYPSALCLDSSAVTPHQCLRLTAVKSSSARPGLAVLPRVRELCWVLSYTGSVWRGRCNTCGGKWPSGFSGPRAHGTFYHIPWTDRSRDCFTIPKRGKHRSTE